ncbi:hypothetical protein DIPPA_17933 [Diplonema papillatum]|nr:hypothetical protein DIPPA_17933 [Diplonema papillatum]
MQGALQRLLVVASLAVAAASGEEGQAPVIQVPALRRDKRGSKFGAEELAGVCAAAAFALLLVVVVFACRDPQKLAALCGSSRANAPYGAKRENVNESLPDLPAGPHDGIAAAPEHFYCPITQSVMADPVSCGADRRHNFERTHLERFFLVSQDKPRCPVCRAPMQAKRLKPNAPLRDEIAAWLRVNRGRRANPILPAPTEPCSPTDTDAPPDSVAIVVEPEAEPDPSLGAADAAAGAPPNSSLERSESSVEPELISAPPLLGLTVTRCDYVEFRAPDECLEQRSSLEGRRRAAEQATGSGQTA